MPIKVGQNLMIFQVWRAVLLTCFLFFLCKYQRYTLEKCSWFVTCLAFSVSYINLYAKSPFCYSVKQFLVRQLLVLSVASGIKWWHFIHLQASHGHPACAPSLLTNSLSLSHPSVTHLLQWRHFPDLVFDLESSQSCPWDPGYTIPSCSDGLCNDPMQWIC